MFPTLAAARPKIVSSVSRRNEPLSPREDTPPFTWIDCYLGLNGEIIANGSERLRPALLHPHVERGPIRLSDNSIIPIVRIDTHFLQTVFIDAWNRAFPAPEPQTVALSGRLQLRFRKYLRPGSAPKKPLTRKDDKVALREFLRTRAGKHSSHEAAHRDAVNTFPDLIITPRRVRAIREEEQLQARRGRRPGRK
jgi:hypothetical protein